MIQYCRWCDKEFTTEAKHQVFCSVECRSKSTKQKNSEKNKKSKVKRRIGKKRNCINCGMELSIYNEKKLCSSCYVDQKKFDKTLREIRKFFDYEKK